MPFHLIGMHAWCAVQVCAAILMKMVMDLWLLHGPGTAFPIVLALLSCAASSAVPGARARAFDMLLNLSAHSELLRPHAGLDHEPHQDAASNAAGSSGAGAPALQPASCGSSAAGAAAVPASATGSSAQSRQEAEHFRHWLRLLLYQLLGLLLQACSLQPYCNMVSKLCHRAGHSRGAVHCSPSEHVAALPPRSVSVWGLRFLELV